MGSLGCVLWFLLCSRDGWVITPFWATWFSNMYYRFHHRCSHDWWAVVLRSARLLGKNGHPVYNRGNFPEKELVSFFITRCLFVSRCVRAWIRLDGLMPRVEMLICARQKYLSTTALGIKQKYPVNYSLVFAIFKLFYTYPSNLLEQVSNTKQGGEEYEVSG